MSHYESVPYFESTHSDVDMWCPVTLSTPNNTDILLIPINCQNEFVVLNVLCYNNYS